jgi:GTPase SAR1 family protein
LTNCSDYLFKLVLIGDTCVGKSCLLVRFAVSYSIITFRTIAFKRTICAQLELIL